MTNVVPIEAAREAKVPRVVLLNATIPAWAPSGYREGKAIAENAAVKFAETGSTAVVLKPSAIFGTRYFGEGHLPLPLWPAIYPVRFIVDMFRCASPPPLHPDRREPLRAAVLRCIREQRDREQRADGKKRRGGRERVSRTNRPLVAPLAHVGSEHAALRNLAGASRAREGATDPRTDGRSGFATLRKTLCWLIFSVSIRPL